MTQFSWKVPVTLLLPLAEMLDRTHQGSHLDLEGLGEIYEQNFNLMSTGPNSFTIGPHSFTASRVNTDMTFSKNLLISYKTSDLLA